MKRKAFTLNRNLRRGLNRALCTALCATMVTSLVPVNVLAAPESISGIVSEMDQYSREWQIVSTWEQLELLMTGEQRTGEMYIRLDKNIREKRNHGSEGNERKAEVWMKLSKGNKILDLNGHSLKLYDGNDSYEGELVTYEIGFVVGDGVSLTIMDTDEGGLIDCDREHVKNGDYFAGPLGNVMSSVPTFDAFRVDKGGKLVINGGKINVGSSLKQWMHRANCDEGCDYYEVGYGRSQVYGSAVQVNGGSLVVNGGSLKGRGTDMISYPLMFRGAEFSADESEYQYNYDLCCIYPYSQAQCACVQITDSNSDVIINGGHFEGRGGAQSIYIGPKVHFKFTGNMLSDGFAKEYPEIVKVTTDCTPKNLKIYGGDFENSDIEREILPVSLPIGEWWLNLEDDQISTRHSRLGAFGIPQAALDPTRTKVTLGGEEVEDFGSLMEEQSKKTLSIRPKTDQPDGGERLRLNYHGDEYVSATGASIDYYLGTNATFYFGREDHSIPHYFYWDEMKRMVEQPNTLMSHDVFLYEYDSNNELHEYRMRMSSVVIDEDGNKALVGNLNGNQRIGCDLHPDCGRSSLQEVNHTYYLAGKATEKMWAYYDNTEKPVVVETYYNMGVPTDTEDYFKQGIEIHTKNLEKFDGDINMRFRDGIVEGNNLVKIGTDFNQILEFTEGEYDAKLVGVTGPDGEMDITDSVNEKNTDYVLHYSITAKAGYTFENGYTIPGIPGANIPYQMISGTGVDNDTIEVYVQVHSYADNNIYGKATVTSGAYMDVPAYVKYDIHDAAGRAISTDILKVTWEVNENRKWTTISEAGANFTPGADLVGKSIRVKVTAEGYDSVCYSEPVMVAAGYSLAGTLVIKNTMPGNGGFVTVQAKTTGKFASVADFNHPTCTYQLQTEIGGAWVDVEDAVKVTKENEPVIDIPYYSELNPGDRLRVKMTADGYTGELYTSDIYAVKPANYAEVEDMQIESVRNADGSVTFNIKNFDTNKEYRTVASLSGIYPADGNVLNENTITLAKNQTLYVYCRYKGDDTHSVGEKFVSGCLDATEYLRNIDLSMNGETVKGSANTLPIIWIPVGNSVELNWANTPADVSKTDFYFYLNSPSGNASLSLSGGVSTDNGDKVFRITGNSVGDSDLYATNVSDNPAWHPSYQLKDYGHWIVRVYDPGDISYSELNSKPSYRQATIEVGDSYTPSVNPVTDSNFKLVPAVAGATLSWELAYKLNFGGAFESVGTENEYASIDPTTGNITCKAPLMDGYMIARIVAKDTNGNAKEVAQMSLDLRPSTRNAIYLDRSEVTLNVDETDNNTTTLLVGFASYDKEGTPDVTFISDDESIATVASDGTVTAKKIGETYVTAYYNRDSDMSAFCRVIVTHNHTYDKGVEKTPVKCLENGTMVYTCEKCSDSYEVPIVATGHKWSDAKITVMPGCNTLGEASHTCSVCNDTEIITIPVTSHNFGMASISEKEHGERCADCGTVDRNTVEEHDLIVDLVKAPTETEEGLMRTACSTCDYIVEDMVPPTGSNMHIHHKNWVGDEENHWKECDDEDCTSATLGATKPSPHTFEDVTVDGVVYKQCTTCKYLQTYEYNINLTVKSYATAEENAEMKIYRDTKEGEPYRIYTEKGVNNWQSELKLTAGTYYFEVSQDGHVTQTFTIKVSNSDVTKSVKLLRSAPVVKTPTQSSAGVTVKWATVPGVNKYRVYRKVGSATGWTKLADVDDIKYVDRTVEKGKTYSYTVRCMNDAGTALISEIDNKGKSIDVTTTIFIDTPKLTGIKNTENGINLTWDAVNGATMYRVYYKGGDNTGGWLKTADVTGTSYNFTKQSNGLALTPGTTYTMTVKCINADKTAASEVDKVGLSIAYKPVTSVTLATPVLTEAVVVENGVTIRWNKVSGAAQYEVRKKDANGKWQAIAKTGLTEYTDTNATSGSQNTYTVCCVNAAGDKATSKYNTTGISAFYMGVAKISAIANTADGIQIKWRAVEGADRYRIYRKEEGGSLDMFKDVKDTTSYVDISAEAGKTYTYSVQPIHMTPKTFGWYDKTGKSMIRLEVPVLKSVTNVAEGIKFKWTPVAGTEKYRVYRKEGNGEFKKLKDVIGKDYTDTTAVSGVTYTYSVKALSMDGTVLSKMNETGLTVIYLAQPKLTGATKVESGVIKVTWEAVAGADGYIVLKKNKDTGKLENYQKIADPKATSYTDNSADKNVDNTYSVRAYKDAARSAYSDTGVTTKG